MEYPFGYREVIPDQNLPDKSKEILLNTGASQSTLQDIKVPERAGGYSYEDASKYFTRNRFIYWRITHDVLELAEYSLELNLVNNRVKYKFNNTPILDGISIHETVDSVIILVVTVSSIHKLSFPHPEKIFRKESSNVSSTQSIFNEVSNQNTRDYHTFHMISLAGSTNVPLAHAAASWLKKSPEEAIFALAYNTGTIVLLRLDVASGLMHTNELKQESIMPRFFSGIATAIRGRTAPVDVTMSLVIHSYKNDILLFALTREGHIRIWSANKVQCVAVLDVPMNSHTSNESIQNYGLKKFTDSSKELYLCTYLKFDTKAEFCVLRVSEESGSFKFIRESTLMAINQHLVDFSFTRTRLWAIWKTSDIDTVSVMQALLPSKKQQLKCKWEPVILENLPEKDCIVNDFSIDPRKAYINYIFHPGRFSYTDITRALNIYEKYPLNRSCSFIFIESFSPDVVPLSSLKEIVSSTVESEIQMEAMDNELMDEDYLEIVNRCWFRFYSCVLQYHVNGSRPVGLLLLSNVCGVVLLKKSSFSFLRPMEPLEYLTLCNEKSYIAQLEATSMFSHDDSTFADFTSLISALITIEERLKDEFKTLFKKELRQLNSPDIIVEKILSLFAYESNDVFLDFDGQSEMYHRLENIQNISSTMAVLLEWLTPGLVEHSNMKNNHSIKKNMDSFLDLHSFFGSLLGTSVISKSVTQITSLKFTICRNLLILQQIILSRPELFDSQNLHIIKSSLAPKTVVLTQAYYAMTWICETNIVITTSQTTLETSLQHLSVLKVTEFGEYMKQQRRLCSLLELFVQYGVKHYVYKLKDYPNFENNSSVHWHSGMLTYVTLVSKLIWPVSENFFFPEWLLFSCQFLLVKEYVRLLSTWCEWNGASRKFFLAVSLLEMGESRKACDHFLRAYNGVIVDDYLANLLLPTNVEAECDSFVYYFLKVIKMFEQHNISDCIIELAMAAMTVAEKYNVNLPTLHSIVFTQHLDLEHHIEAYNYLNTNPDAERRTDCLRQLIVTLFNRKKLLNLISFPYVDMYQDLEKIMEERARCIDLTDYNYYNFLYSFYINKGNLRKAASIMYEQALRFRQEPQTLANIAKESNCLLVCLNTLHLVQETYRWIVRPIMNSSYSEKENDFTGTEKLLTMEEMLKYRITKRIDLLEMPDIKKEYVLTEARLKLAKLNPDISIVYSSDPSETISILSRVGLFVDALEICENFKISKTAILEDLTSACVRLNRDTNLECWDWLQLNDVSDFCITTVGPSNISWMLLEHSVMSHEKPGQSDLHKCVARTLYQLGEFLPLWLYFSYAKRNSPELLRLMIKMGRLEEAGYFTIEYVKAVLSKQANEMFGLKSVLWATNPAVCLPFNIIELLLLELQYTSKHNEYYVEIFESLKATMEKYMKTVERVSLDMIELKSIKSSVS